MAETLTPTNSPNLQSFRSRLKQLMETPTETTPVSDPKELISDCASHLQGIVERVEVEASDVGSLAVEDLDAYLEQLKKEISLTQEENTNISSKIGDLSRTLVGDSNQLAGDLESLDFLLKRTDSQGLQYSQASRSNGTSFSGDTHAGPMDVSEDHRFEILELCQHIEKKRDNLSTLLDVEYVFKRVETASQIEDQLSEVKVLEFKGNCIRLSLKTHIPSSDSLLLRHKLDCLIEPSVLDHELLIEVVDKTLELHNMEIFPNDVSLDDIIHTIKSSSHLPSAMSRSNLHYLIRQVQYRIILCALRRLLVKDANNSRYSLEYSDRDETVTAYLVGGINAFIRAPLGWPISTCALKLLSVKTSDVHSKSISLSFLCRVTELANSLDTQTRCNLARFISAIEEILVREMHSELHSNDIPA